MGFLQTRSQPHGLPKSLIIFKLLGPYNLGKMHILVVNDDGPPSNQSSPYVHSLVKSLQEAGHIVSVVLPHTQRSWIGKAHIIGQTVKPTYFVLELYTKTMARHIRDP